MNWIYGLLALVVIGLGVAGVVWWNGNQPKNLAAHEQVVAGNAVVGEHQAQANMAAQQIIVSGEARNHLDIQVHQQNAQAIQTAPGGSQKLDPGFISTFNRGLCKYATDASDPGCSGLYPGNSAVVPSSSPQPN